MRILIACDKFKGSLAASAACAAIARGMRKRFPDAEIDECPIADGGEGFAEALAAPLGGQWVEVAAHDALGRPVMAKYLLTRTDGKVVAVMEMAGASGLWRIGEGERDILSANSCGTGEMIRHAIEISGAEKIVIGLGGSATNDGGAGMATELGVRFLDANGNAIKPSPGALAGCLAKIDLSGYRKPPPIVVACDVDSPLLGPLGATRVFGPQKGADAATMPILEAALEAIVRCSAGEQTATRPGSGAAGGLGFGLIHFAVAEMMPGFEIVASLSGLEKRIEAADIVITGEGSLDAQTLAGKGPAGVARLARKYHHPVWAFCGRADLSARNSGLFDRITELALTGLPVNVLLSRAASLLTDLASGDKSSMDAKDILASSERESVEG